MRLESVTIVTLLVTIAIHGKSKAHFFLKRSHENGNFVWHFNFWDFVKFED